MSLIQSENIFSKFIDCNDIILDNHYDNLRNYYNYNFLDIKKNNQYYHYINLFKKYYHLKNDINLIYYIIILYYIDKKNLVDFIRFYTSKINFYNLNSNSIIIFDKVINYNKIQLIQYLQKNINQDYKNFIFFIFCLQNYI